MMMIDVTPGASGPALHRYRVRRPRTSLDLVSTSGSGLHPLSPPAMPRLAKPRCSRSVSCQAPSPRCTVKINPAPSVADSTDVASLEIWLREMSILATTRPCACRGTGPGSRTISEAR
eukprot:304983-Prymnesium_polylepis.3